MSGITWTGSNAGNARNGGQFGDTLDGRDGNDRLNGAGGNDLVLGGSGGDLLWGGVGNDTVLGDSQRDTSGAVVSSAAPGDDVIFGGAGNDSLGSGGGDDVIEGNTGNDTIDGGDGIDEVGFELTSATPGSLTVTQAGTGWQVVSTTDGTDQLSNVEIVVDGNGARTLLVGNGGFASIQAAVDAAIDGDTILIGSGTFTGDVSNVSGKALSFVGQGAGTIVQGMFNVEGTLAGALSFKNLTINAAGEEYGIRAIVTSNGGSLSLEGVTISNAMINGLAYGHPSNGNRTDAAPAAEILDAVSIVNSSFIDNGNANGQGRGGVSLFGFDGDLTVTGTTFDGSGFGKAMQVVGLGRPASSFDPASLTFSSLGNVTFSNNTLTGAFGQDGIAFYSHAGFTSFTATGNTANASAPWGLLNLDWVGGDFNLSNFFSGATNTFPGSATLPAAVIVSAQGTNDAAGVTGTSGNDGLNARGGNDTINAGDGADTINAGAGADSVDAGAGNDRLIVANANDLDGTEAIDGGTGQDVLVYNAEGAGSAVTLGAGVTNVEFILPNFGAVTAPFSIDASAATGVQWIGGTGGDNTLIGGDGDQLIQGGNGNDSLSGGAGNDQLQGGHGADTLSGGDGNDTLFGGLFGGSGNGNDSLSGGAGNDQITGAAGTDTLSGGAGNDTLTGGGGALDTAKYGVTLAGTDVSFNVDWIVNAGTEGTDRLQQSFGIIEHAGGRILLVGGGGFTTLQAAIDAANDGDTIRIAAGNYSDPVSITKSLTILGAKAGTDGAAAGRGSGEAVISGLVTVNMPAGALNISGVEFRYTGARDTLGNDGLVNVIGAGSVTIQDSRFMTDASQGGAPGGRALMVPTGFTGTLVVDDNFFGGAVTDIPAVPATATTPAIPAVLPQFGGAAWRAGIWSDGNSTSLTITDNVFQTVRTAANLDGYDDEASTVTGNRVNDSGTGFSVGVPLSANTFAGIDGNVFSNVGTEFNLRNLTTDLNFTVGTDAVAGAGTIDVVVGAGADTVTGGDGADVLSGNNGADRLDGGNGADVLAGGNGNDTLLGGNGADALSGGNNDDQLVGGNDNDTLSGDDGNDALNGNDGNDSLAGGNGSDALIGGAGDDTLDGGDGQDIVLFSVEDDMTVDLGAGTASGDGNDSLSGIENVRTFGGNDRITGSDVSNSLDTGNGNDTVVAGGGNDAVTASNGNDSVDGGDGADFLNGGDGNDTLLGGNGADYIEGVFGADSLSGGNGDDTLVGGPGNTNDTLDGGDGVDRAIFRADDTTTFIRNFDGSITATGPLGTDLLKSIEFIDLVAESNGASLGTVNLTTILTPDVTVRLTTDTGGNTTDSITSNGALTGTGRPNTDLTITWTVGTTVATQTARVDAFGNWTATPPSAVVDGTVSVSVSQMDGAGGTDSATFDFTLDGAAPTAPTLDLDAASDTGASNSDNITNANLAPFSASPSPNENKLTINGTGDPGLAVVVSLRGDTIGTAVADANGNWSVTHDVSVEADGLLAYSATAIDAAGNISDAGTLNVTLDRSAPGGTSVNLAAASDTGLLNNDLVTKAGTLTLTGTTDPGAFVEVFRGNDYLGNATADGSGNWSFDHASALEGTFGYAAFTVDVAGNRNDLAAVTNITVDRTAPAAATLTEVVINNTTGSDITVRGTKEDGSGFSLLGQTVGLAGTAFAVDATVPAPTPLQPSTTLQVTAEDLAGNEAAPSNAYTLTVDAAGAALVGAATNDRFTANGGNDTLDGGAGNDTLSGGTGNDVLAVGDGADSVEGGAGFDIVSYARASDSVLVNLADPSQNEDAALNDTLSGIEGVIGTAFVDALFGDANANLLDGGGEADLLFGGNGNDTLIGGAGADEMDGEDGFDVASYATAAVAITIVLGATGAAGDAQGDVLTNIEGLVGSASNDSLGGNAAANLIDGGAGNDTVRGGAGADTLFGGAGVDMLSYSTATTSVSITLGSGQATGSGGEAALDIVSGFEGVTGGAGSDVLTGDNGDNLLIGNNGNDQLRGTGGNDTLDGGAGNDVLRGGAGNDSLIGGGLGASNRDTVDYGDATAGVRVTLGNPGGVLGSATSATTVDAGIGTDTLATDIENIRGSNFGDVLTGTAGSLANLIEGGGGADTISGLGTSDTLNGGAGNDIFVFTVTSATSITLGEVSDFTRGQDRIDLFATDANLLGGTADDGFVFMGTGAFTGLGQVRVVQDGLNTRVELNVTGTGLNANLSDANFTLVGVTASSLTAADFIL